VIPIVEESPSISKVSLIDIGRPNRGWRNYYILSSLS
jgi:hypothetical protein